MRARAADKPFHVRPLFSRSFPISLDRIRRVLRKRPSYVAARLWHEGISRTERFRGPRRVMRHAPDRIERWAGRPLADLWTMLAARPGPVAPPPSARQLDALVPGEVDRLRALADDAAAHRVDLLGSGPVSLGPDIDWHRDFKTGIRFEPAFCRSIAYNDLDRPSDVKVPWELSRMQWLIPAGQYYQLTGDERYARAVRDTIDHWIEHNPYAFSVNWACTMDVGLRAISWVWFFHALHASEAWRDDAFRARFLAALYMHGDFIARQLEKADVNGNHYTADAAGLVFVGLFLGDVGKAPGWAAQGWSILESEIDRQVHPDGVDFESSVPYHRLVQELFLYPALYRRRCGEPVARSYADRLVAMARFTEAYSRGDGSVPLWGDADDARTLPFRHDAINDHRYLIALVASFDPRLSDAFSGNRAEIAWMLGADIAGALPEQRRAPPRSVAFPAGGFFVLRDERNHVFVDCGDIGLAGRGGHGHSDLLACEIALRGELLVTDCGAYLYTADYRERNAFRSTAYHNTPQVDGEEIYRFVRPDYLWVLHNDATPRVDRFEASDRESVFEGQHDGYARLADPTIVRRRIALDHAADSVTIADTLLAAEPHRVTIPYHLAPDVTPTVLGDGRVRLDAGGGSFVLEVREPGWTPVIERARVSPSYGVVRPAWQVVLTASGRDLACTCEIKPLAP